MGVRSDTYIVACLSLRVILSNWKKINTLHSSIQNNAIKEFKNRNNMKMIQIQAVGHANTLGEIRLFSRLMIKWLIIKKGASMWTKTDELNAFKFQGILLMWTLSALDSIAKFLKYKDLVFLGNK